MREKKTILVVMSEGSKRDTITVTLIRNHFNVHVAVAVKEAISAADQLRPHMIILSMDLQGEAIIRSLRKSYDGPVLALSESGEESVTVNALDAGANDVLNLPFGRPEHMARIRAALRYGSVFPSSVANGVFSVGGLSIDYASRQVIVDGKKARLTPIEYRILTFLTKNAGMVLTHDQIINEVWGPYNSDNLVLRVNMANIRRKIEKIPSEPKYVLTEVGVGYRVVSE